MIKYVKYKNIDSDAWDNCIKQSINKDVTVLSGYLDICYKHWDALVLDNYKAVMPLPVQKNFVNNLYVTNFLSPQLGVYSKAIDEELVMCFMRALKSRFRKFNYTFNKFNFFKSISSVYNVKQAREFDIITNEIVISNSDFVIDNEVSNNEIVNFVENNKVISNIDNKLFDASLLRQLMAYVSRNNILYKYVVYNKHNNIIAFAFFVKSFSKDKLLYIAIKEKSVINDVFTFVINNHISNCRQNISIDLGFSDTYFGNIYKVLQPKPYNVFQINNF